MRSDPKVIATINDAKINGEFPFYKYGHRVELNRELMAQDKDRSYKFKKYPLVALRMDIPETVSNGYWQYKLNIAIMMSTQKQYNAADRMVHVFKPILYPMYESFLRLLTASGTFTWPERLEMDIPPHTKIDRPFWGTPTTEGNIANIFEDALDAIEIVDLQISSRQRVNCP